jgi:hypothetical protein
MSPEEKPDETRVSNETVGEPEQLREQIEEDREQLGETVEALAEKADVKGQVKEKVEQAKQRPVPIGAVVAGVLGALLLLRFLRRR